MKPYRIYSTELPELADLPNPFGNMEGPVMRMSKQHHQVGTLQATSFVLPHMLVMDMEWQLKEDILIEENDLAESVCINFQLQGTVLSDFKEITSLPVEGNTHNLLYSMPAKHTHHICRNQHMKTMHMSLDKTYFKQLVGAEDEWSEKVLTRLERNEPFLGEHSMVKITAPMTQLIYSIQQHNWQGPARNLHIQSKIFELLALQLDQFRWNTLLTPGITKEDVEKLYLLRTYIQEHFLEDLSLFQLARISTLNEFKLKKGFKSLFGNSIFHYIKQLRMEYAGQLLLDERRMVEEVAFELGYEHAHHFSAGFKKYFGVSPSHWR